jgi:hypothetical protein
VFQGFLNFSRANLSAEAESAMSGWRENLLLQSGELIELTADKSEAKRVIEWIHINRGVWDGKGIGGSGFGVERLVGFEPQTTKTSHLFSFFSLNLFQIFH